MNATAQAFDACAAGFARSPELALGETRDRLLEHLDPVADESLLDLGCGPGAMTRAAGPFVGRVVAFDIAPVMLRALALESQRAGRRVPPRVRGTALALPFRDGAFDLVACRHASRYVDDAVALARECARVLSRGGRLAIVDAAPTGDAPADAALVALHALREPAPAVLRGEAQWRAAFESAGLRVEWTEAPLADQPGGRSLLAWCAEAGVSQDGFARAHAQLLALPTDSQRALGLLVHGADLQFHPPCVVAAARRIDGPSRATLGGAA